METADAPAKWNHESGNGNTPANLSAAWDAVFGSGYYTIMCSDDGM